MNYYGSVDKETIKKIVKEVCTVLGNGKNNNADKLILGTIAQETHMGTYPDSTPGEKGIGLCQFDKIAYEDVILNTKEYKKKKILKEFGIDINKVTYKELEFSPVLSIIFCRLKYQRVPDVIPLPLEGMASYWKEHYNSFLGAGSPEDFISNYKKYI